MTERDRIVRSVTFTLLIFGLLLLLVGGCQAISEDSDDECGWFALAAAEKPAPPRPAPVKPAAPAPAPAPVRKAPSLDKPKAPAAAPAPVRKAPSVEKPKAPRPHVDIDVDLEVDPCD